MRPHNQESSEPGTAAAGALPCIWMSAGLVAYKLCDRNFECDGCPFDQAMRGVPPRRTGLGETPAPLAAAEPLSAAVAGRFPGDRRYHPAHAWAERRPGGGVRIGIDSLFAALAGRPGAVVLAAAGSPLERGRSASWLVTRGELIPVPSPIDGTVRRRNERLAAEPGLAASDPYGEGWLLEAEVSGEDPDALLLDAAAARRRAERRRAAFLAEAAALLEPGRRAVGPTLPDGGLPLRDLEQMLGPGRYYRLAARHLAADPDDRAGLPRPARRPPSRETRRGRG